MAEFGDTIIHSDSLVRTVTLEQEVKHVTIGLCAMATRHSVDLRYVMKLVEDALKSEGLL